MVILDIDIQIDIRYIRIFLNDRQLVSGYFILILGKEFKFCLWFQRHKQEGTQVKLVLQNKLN